MACFTLSIFKISIGMNMSLFCTQYVPSCKFIRVYVFSKMLRQVKD
jgi:hypothetical protein